MRHLAAAEQATDEHLVAGFEEVARALHLGLQVVFAGARADPELLDLHLVLLAAARLLFLLLLVLELAVVHDAAHGRPLVGGNFYEVEPLADRQGQRVCGLEDAELLVVLVDDANLANPDLVVDARATVLRGTATRIRPGHMAS